MSFETRDRSVGSRAVLRAALALLVLPLVFVGPALLPGKRFLPDAPRASPPLSIEDPTRSRAMAPRASPRAADRIFRALTDELAIQRAWRRGEVPSWDPSLGLGVPLAAGTTTGVWYPPNALKIVLAPDLAGGWLALLALFLAGLGMRAFLLARGSSPCAANLGAWSMQSGGFALSSLQLASMVDAGLWLPFAFLAVEGILARHRLAGLGLALSIAASALAGFAPIAVLVTGATLFYALWRSVESSSIGRAPVAVAWVALGVLAAAVQWIPALEASGESVRGRQTSAEVEAQSLPPAALLTLVAPDFLGAPSDGFRAPHNAAAWAFTSKADASKVSTGDPLEWCLFAGVGVLVLALAAIAGRTREALLPCALLLLALGFALGWPLVRLLYALPGLDLGAPSRAGAIAWMAWPWLAALGLDALLDGCRRAGRAAWLASLGLLLAGGVTYFAFAPGAFAQALPERLAKRHGTTLEHALEVVPRDVALRAGERIWTEGERLALVALGALAAAFATRRLPRENIALRAAPWFLLAAIEGSLFAREHLAPLDLREAALFPASSAIDAIRDAAGDGRVVRFDTSASEFADAEELAPPNLLAAYGIADLTPNTLFTPRSLVELVAAVDPRSLDRTGLRRVTDPSVLGSRVLDLLRVTCVLARAPLANERLTAVAELPRFHVYARSRAFPAARVVPPSLVVASNREAVLGLLTQDGFDARRAAVAFADDLPAESERPKSSGAAFTPGMVEVSRPAADRLDARVRASSGGWLVFHDQFAPGWKATVNGLDAPVVRVDHVCRAVPIPPGDSVVRTKYEPWSLRIGATLSLGAIAIALLASLAPWRSRSRATRLH